MTDWVRIGVDVGGSRNPERDAQQRKERREARARWDEMQAALPDYRTRLAAVQGVHLPAMLGEEAQAVATLQAAGWGLVAGAVREQGGQTLVDRTTGERLVALEQGEAERDPAHLAALAELQRIRKGISELRAQEHALQHNISRAEYTSPPPPAD